MNVEKNLFSVSCWCRCRFRLRYHPEDVECSDAKTRDVLQKRLGVYMYLSGMGWFDNVSLDIHQAPAILKVLDAGKVIFNERYLYCFY